MSRPEVKYTTISGDRLPTLESAITIVYDQYRDNADEYTDQEVDDALARLAYERCSLRRRRIIPHIKRDLMEIVCTNENAENEQ